MKIFWIDVFKFTLDVFLPLIPESKKPSDIFFDPPKHKVAQFGNATLYQ